MNGLGLDLEKPNELWFPLFKNNLLRVAKEIIGYKTGKTTTTKTIKTGGDGRGERDVEVTVETTVPVYDPAQLRGTELCTYDKKFEGYFSDIDIQIAPIVRKALANKDIPSAYLPDDFLTTYIYFLYDVISPIFGVGSNLDYLGYQKFLPLDFFVSFLMNLFAKMEESGDAALGELGPITDKVETSNFLRFFPNQYFKSIPQSILPLRAFYAIWWNNYRDQLLETAAPEPKTTTAVTDDELLVLLAPRQRAWSKDAFTTALANTGTGSVMVPTTDVFRDSQPFKDYVVTGADAESADLQQLNLRQITLADGKVIELPTRYLSSFHTTTSNGSSTSQGFSLDTLRRAGRAEKWGYKRLLSMVIVYKTLYLLTGVYRLRMSVSSCQSL